MHKLRKKREPCLRWEMQISASNNSLSKRLSERVSDTSKLPHERKS